MKTSLLAFAAALLATTVGGAHAHNAWLLPSTTVLSKGDVVTIDAAISNDLFVANHAAMRIDGLQITAPDGSLVKPETEARLKQRAVFDVNVAQPGTYRIAVLNAGLFASWKDKATGQQKRARGGTAETHRQGHSTGRDRTSTSRSRRAVSKPS